MRGRKPIPTRLKLLSGNPGKRPIQAEPTPAPGPLPEAPAFLDPYGLEEWTRLAFGLHGLGLLSDLDVAVLAAYCTAYSLWRQGVEELVRRSGDTLLRGVGGGVAANAELTRIVRQQGELMLRFASEFGLTPAARARLRIEPKKPGGKFHGLTGLEGEKK